jgi:4a-hydroxytetrahydrobiopterin dehydratase
MEKFIQKQWEERDDQLYKAVIFKDFQQAFYFIMRIAFLAEKYNHHPRWTNEYNKVEIWLYTHDLGGRVTEKDRMMALEIDKLLKQELDE